MRYEVYISKKKQCRNALKEIIELIAFEPATVFFFSNHEHFSYYTEALKKYYPKAEIYGATVTTLFTSDNIDDDSFVVYAADGEVECFGGVLEEISRYPDKYAKRVKNCVEKLSDVNHSVCLEFTTALYGCEELVLDTLNKVLAPYGIPVAGASTGVADGPAQNKVSYNGIVYDEASIFLIIHNRNGRIALYRENIFYPTKTFFYATDVDIRKRIVRELDERPAADVLAEALGTNREQLQEMISLHPLGRECAGNIYITDAKEILPDGSILFYASIYGNTKMVLLKLGDYRAIMKDTISQIKKEIPKPRFGLMINCYSRTQMFRKDGFAEEFREAYSDLFDNNFICFTGLGEQLYNTHLNQSLVMVVFE